MDRGQGHPHRERKRDGPWAWTPASPRDLGRKKKKTGFNSGMDTRKALVRISNLIKWLTPVVIERHGEKNCVKNE